MYRSALDYLINWKKKRRRKPLLIRGARQVGKSYLVFKFAQEHFTRFFKVDFEKYPDMETLFKGTPAEIIHLLELKFNEKIDLKNSLLFLDEIQAKPEVIAKLYSFYEYMPELSVIAASSHLECVLEPHAISKIAGKVEYLYLAPMTFMEFLQANGNTMLYNYIKNYSSGSDISEAIHSNLMSLFQTYLIVGGMPEAVAAFVNTQSFHNVEIVKESILRAIEDDFNIYSSQANHQRIFTVFKKLPFLVGQKFKYVAINRNIRAKNIAVALHALEMANIAFLVKHSICDTIPLGIETNEKKFKILFLDVGLLASACGLSKLDIESVEELMNINSGGLCKQFVGQHLRLRKYFYKKPELYYWVREAKSSTSEIDYVISENSRRIPVVIKVGKTGRLKALQQFIKEKGVDLAVRINYDMPSVIQESNTMHNGKKIEYKLISIPFYLIEQIRRIIRESHNS